VDSERMKNAMQLASKCWSKAMSVEPEFVEAYFRNAELLLSTSSEVRGHDFKDFCTRRGLSRPSSLHHNVWVSGVGALEKLGWIRKDGYVTPAASHNHMPVVNKWTSLIYKNSPSTNQIPTQLNFPY